MATASRDPYIRKRGPLAGREVWRGYATNPVTGKVTTAGRFTSHTDALVWAKGEERDLARAAAAPPEPSPVPTVTAWWEIVQERGWWPVSEGNRANRDRDLRLYALHRWGSTPLDRLQPADVTDWLLRLTTSPTADDRLPGEYRKPSERVAVQRLEGGVAPPARPVQAVSVGTGARAYAALRRLVQIAVERSVLPYNPVAAARLPPRPGRLPRYAELVDVSAAAQHLPERLRYAALVAALTGLRLGELRALDETSWQPGRDRVDIDRVIIEPAGGQFAWRPVTKGTRPRTVPLVPRAQAFLERHAAAFPPVPVPLRAADDDGRPRGRDVTPTLWFTDTDGGPLRRARVSDAWERAQDDAGTQTRTTWHGLRHTYASLLISADEPLARVAQLMGHSVQRTTELYGWIIDSEHKSARARLSAATAVIAWDDDEADAEAADLVAWVESFADDLAARAPWNRLDPPPEVGETGCVEDPFS